MKTLKSLSIAFIATMLLTSNTLQAAWSPKNANIWLAKTLPYNNNASVACDPLSLVRTLCLSHDGRILYSGSTEGTIKIWDLKTKSCIFMLLAHKGPVNSLRLSPDNKFLFSSSQEDNTTKIWNVYDLSCNQ